MRIAHAALWTRHPEELKNFYVRWFGGEAGPKYVNPAKGFESYFVRFGAGAALEIMRNNAPKERPAGEPEGFCHLAFAVGRREEVLGLTERLRAAGYTVAGEPRTTGDGYFESVILDPDGNRIELVAENERSPLP